MWEIPLAGLQCKCISSAFMGWECEEKWQILIWLHKFAVIKNVSFKLAELKWILSWNSNQTQVAN